MSAVNPVSMSAASDIGDMATSIYERAADFCFGIVNGSVTLRLITPGSGVRSLYFTPAERDKFVKALEENDQNANVYFTTNPTNGPGSGVGGAVTKSDLKEFTAVHADIDLAPDEDRDAGRRRILERIGELTSEPSGIVDSGNGYQIFYVLESPVSVEEGEAMNRALAEQVCGDMACVDAGHVMRVPGLINIPNEKKKKAGRQRVRGALVSWDGRKHAPAGFPRSEKQRNTPVQAIEDSRSAARPIQSIGELDEWSVPERVKVIIQEGRHPDRPKSLDNSRSAWLWDAVCHLARCRVPEDIILGLLLDRRWRISESVLELGTGAEKYARRQVVRAYEVTALPWLDEFNQKHAVIGNIGGKCLIMNRVWNDTLRQYVTVFQGFDHFRNRYRNQLVQVGEDQDGTPKIKPVADAWINHPHRRQYEGVTFSPGKHPEGMYNLYQGFPFEPSGGRFGCRYYLHHVWANVCRRDKELFRYVIRWMARCVQEPEKVAHVAIVLKGKRGTGKSKFATEFGELFRPHFRHFASSEHFVGRFNGDLQDALLVFADEAFYAGDKKHVAFLKALITEAQITIERKGIDAEQAPNRVKVIMASNDDRVVPAGPFERRFLTLEVGDEKCQDSLYFARIMDQMENGGRQALLGFLLKVDLRGFDVRCVPRTDALIEQQERNLSGYAKLLYGWLQSGHIEFVTAPEAKTVWVPTAGMIEHGYREHIRIDNQEIAQLNKAIGYKKRRRMQGRGYDFPALEEARRRWADHFGWEVTCDPGTSDWVGTEEVPF